MTTYHRFMLDITDDADADWDEVAKMVEVALLHNLTDSSIKFNLTEYEEEE